MNERNRNSRNVVNGEWSMCGESCHSRLDDAEVAGVSCVGSQGLNSVTCVIVQDGEN